jgi:adenylate kinase family enzyme
MKRLLARGRPDDLPEVIAHRLKVNREETAPLLPYYESNAHLLHVDLPPGSTKAEVLNFVEAALKSNNT